MADMRDRLLELNRDQLEVVAQVLRISVTGSMSRAELITSIEQRRTIEEWSELQPFLERRVLIVGLLFVTIATFILTISTALSMSIPGFLNNPFSVLLIASYYGLRGTGGFLIAMGLFSLGLKVGHRSITSGMRVACILGAVFIIIIVIILLPLPADWFP